MITLLDKMVLVACLCFSSLWILHASAFFSNLFLNACSIPGELQGWRQKCSYSSENLIYGHVKLFFFPYLLFFCDFFLLPFSSLCSFSSSILLLFISLSFQRVHSLLHRSFIIPRFTYHFHGLVRILQIKLLAESWQQIHISK